MEVAAEQSIGKARRCKGNAFLLRADEYRVISCIPGQKECLKEGKVKTY
jgi:hypothetical protein